MKFSTIDYRKLELSGVGQILEKMIQITDYGV